MYLICGWYDIFDHKGVSTGKKEFIVSHGVDEVTMNNIVLPQVHPNLLGARYSIEKGWYLPDD
jgi:hypothetical protein